MKKTCSICNQTKTIDSFNFKRRNKDQRDTRCKPCQKAYSRAHDLKNFYGISTEDYNNLFAQQNGKCAICGKTQTAEKRQLAVDHDHKTGAVRGLLCGKCNMTLGLFHDKASIFLEMYQYLTERGVN